jgi:flagellar basal body-associated protein FliL
MADPAVDAPVIRRPKKKLIVIGAAVLALVLALGTGAVFFLKQRAAHAAAAADDETASPEASTPAAAAAAKGAPFYLPLDPFIVNLADKEADRYLQIGITFELENSMSGDTMKGYMPAIRNAILMILANKTSKDLLSREGKEQLALEIQREAVKPMGIEVAAPEPVTTAPAATGASAAAAHERAIDALSASLGLGAPLPGVDPALAPNPAPALALATPIDAPDFAAALGVRVSLLAQDGVQRAELHLNPAETGPVSIHISLDGTAARVDFGADVAATRAAIERGLPELASALRDAGFTLAGGGVSQHAGGRAGSDGETGRSGPRGAGPVSTSIATDSRTVVRSVAAGGVDLYA